MELKTAPARKFEYFVSCPGKFYVEIMRSLRDGIRRACSSSGETFSARSAIFYVIVAAWGTVRFFVR